MIRALLDANIVIDVLERRQEFYAESAEIFSQATNYQGFIAASNVTDIYYIEHRCKHSKEKTLELMKKLFKLFDIIDTTAADCRNALRNKVADFEDAVMVESALREDIDLIVTRNIKDFQNSPVKACTPTEFLNLLSAKRQV